MFTNSVSIFEKILLQSTLIFSIWWHVALPFLKLSKAVNVTGLKYDQKTLRNFRNNVLLFYLFLKYYFFPSISLCPICSKIKQSKCIKADTRWSGGPGKSLYSSFPPSQSTHSIHREEFDKTANQVTRLNGWNEMAKQKKKIAKRKKAWQLRTTKYLNDIHSKWIAF